MAVLFYQLNNFFSYGEYFSNRIPAVFSLNFPAVSLEAIDLLRHYFRNGTQSLPVLQTLRISQTFFLLL
jgi:hypothetical protein